jgi:hypothetical protein
MPSTPGPDNWEDEFKAIQDEIAKRFEEGQILGGPTVIVNGPVYDWNKFVEEVRKAGIDLRRRGDK